MKPQAWKTGTVDAIATGSVDGRRIVVKAVNYEGQLNTLLIRLQGYALPEKAAVRIYTLSAGLTDAASIERPDKIRPVETTVPYSRNLTIELPPYGVSVIEIVANDMRK
jgi:alpha-N-arabinofuranosidase